MKTKLAQAFIGAFLAILFGSQAVANSQIKEDFAYAFGSSDGLDSGSIRLLSSGEMDETEGLFISWVIRMGPRIYRGLIDALKVVGVPIVNWRKGHIDVWIRIGESYSKTRGFSTRSIRWGSNRYYRDEHVQNLILREFNGRLHEMKIPLNTWRTNDPGHLHLWRINRRPRTPQPPDPGPSSLASRGGSPVTTPPLHDGSGGDITEIDWEGVTAEDLLTGRFDEALLDAAAEGPTGTKWGMEEITENQARLALTVLAFVVDPANNADVDIPLTKLWEHMRLAHQIHTNPEKRNRAARMVRLGLKQLRYIIGQHSQDYHSSEDSSDDEVSGTIALSDVFSADALTADSASTPDTAPDRNTYLPIQANWWMHDIDPR